MNQLPVNFTLYYPTLEQLISFAGYYSLFVIFCLILLLFAGLVSGVTRQDSVYGFWDFFAWAFGLIGFVILIPISMIPCMKNFDWSSRIVYPVMFSSPFVVFYMVAWAGIV